MDNFLRKYKLFKINEFLKGKFKLATRAKTMGETEKECCRSARLESFAGEVFMERMRVDATQIFPAPQIR